MKIREIRLNQFKRFTDTTITDIPITAKLVLLAGPNGCGKSSLIDAVSMWHRTHWAQTGNWDATYHQKQIPGNTVEWHNSVSLTFHGVDPVELNDRRKAVYIRTAYRNEPEFQMGSLERVGPAVAENRIGRMIDNDQAVSQNYRRMVSDAFEDVFDRAPGEQTIDQFREQTLGSIKKIINRLFPGLALNSLGNPLSVGTFRFDKGESKSFLYKNLSGGEKAAFDLLLDLLIKRREFNDTVFFVDEPEAHMAPALQGVFLEEFLGLVPENSQLWLATHSLGMMRKARDIARNDPGTVVFLDFEGENFDIPTTLRPIQPDRPFWKRAMQIALDDLAGYVAPEQVVLCEGGRVDGGADFDAQCYNEIFKAEFPQAVFLGAGNANDIQNDPRGVGRLLESLAPGVHVRRVIDRDDRTNAEIETLQAQHVRVLTRRTIESYLLDDEILEAVCVVLGSPQASADLIAAKATALANSVAHGGPPDDFKRPAGDIYNAAKLLLPGHKLGSDKRAFMKGICAPQIVPGTQTYAALRHEIFGA
jgi:hypothetical protein